MCSKLGKNVPVLAISGPEPLRPAGATRHPPRPRIFPWRVPWGHGHAWNPWGGATAPKWCAAKVLCIECPVILQKVMS